MSPKLDNKTTVVDRAEGFLAGMQKRFPNGSQQLTFAGGAQSVTVTQTNANLTAIVSNRAATVAAQAAATAKVAQENSQLPALVAFLSALEAFIRLTFGADAVALADFSLAPPKARVPMTAEEKAVAAAKREATRKARGTTSAKAKKAVHGNVTATLVVSAVSPAPAAPAAAAVEAAAPAGAVVTAAKS